ncbi:phosphatase PAP2 family protein [Aquabacterium sp.]|uniref:phosphatase PAP2 family protein n=1 Tax=Aquabacterium sp. TaxID=1872578 RepID=UPI002CE9E060|nr:phosphatase PAP2 family protein [Aquabacterium sp.]HSW06021.1 phosphatase PAP2 family protein [Aquabacterium sp.]
MPAFNSTSFLSGLHAGWSPIGPRRGATWSPIGPSHSPIGPSHSPIGPSASPIGPGRAWAPGDATADASALGEWEGIDAPWTYANGATLQAQALLKSRARTAAPADALAIDSHMPPAADRGPEAADLWRWAPEFRMMAVSAELGGRVFAHDRQVWLTGPGRAAATRLYALPANFDHIDWADQIDAVMRAAVEREDRLPEILSQASSLWAFFESVCGVSLDRAPTFRELVLAAEDWALKLLMLLKHNVGARRPVELSSLIHPVIQTPGHGSLPSGHATLAAMNTELLTLMLYSNGRQPHRAAALNRLARRIAFNRVVAGVHFPVDSQAGYVLGRQLARALASLAGHPPAIYRTRDAHTVIADPWRLHEQPEAELEADDVEPPAHADIAPPEASPLLHELWGQAQTELDRLRV